MSDNLEGLDVETEETSADTTISTDEAVDPMDTFYGAEDDDKATEVADESLDTEADDTVSDADEESTEVTFTLKADGEEHTLNEEKMKEYASKGIRFYNAMDELATERKQFEAEKQEQQSKIAETISKLESFLGEQPELSIDELGADEYLKQTKQREAAEQALNEAKQQQQAKQQEAYEAHVNQEVNLLAEKMGARWSDTEVMNADIASAKEWMKSFGATDQELSTAINHKFWQMGIKGAQLQAELDKLSKKKEAVTKQIKQAPKTVDKSGGKAPTVRDAADVFYG